MCAHCEMHACMACVCNMARPLQRWPAGGYTVGGRSPPPPGRYSVGPLGVTPLADAGKGGQHACAACAAGLHMHVVHVRIWRGGGGVCAAVRRAANACTGTVQCAWACDVWGCAAGRAQTVHWQCGVMGQCGAAVIGRRAGIGRAGGHSPVKSLKSPGPVWPSTAVRRPLDSWKSPVFST